MGGYTPSGRNLSGGTVTGPSGTWDSGGLDIATSDSYAVNGTDILSDSAGTMTLSNIDALDATSEASIEAAIDTLANLTAATSLASVGTITSGTWSATDVAVAAGGTGASDAATARTNLGVGTGDSPQFTGIELGHASDTTLTRPAAGVLAVEGVVVGLTGQHTIWVPAAAMEAAVTTAAATSNAVEIGTSLFAARTMDFATDADDFAYFGIQMPKSWDAGTLICQFVWSATGTTANTVLWAIAATSLGDDEVLTTAFPAPASPAADTNSTTADDIMISAEVTLTVGDTPTAENYVIFEVSRDVSGDTLAEDARLHGIRIHYTTDTGNDT